MTDDNVKAMVDSLADGDNIAAQDAFKTALSDKIGSALDDKRMTVAIAIFYFLYFILSLSK